MHRSLTGIFVAILGMAGCAGSLHYATPSTARAPGADAKILADVKKDQNETLLEISITNLAPPGRVAEGALHFVAWQRHNGATPWARVAAVKYDDGSRKGELSASVPVLSFDFEVSAEKEADAASPSPDVVLEQHIN